MLPLLPRAALHFLNAFVVLAILIILFFPSHTESQPTTTTVLQADITATSKIEFSGTSAHPNILMNLQHPVAIPYIGANTQTHFRWASSTLTVLGSIFQVLWAITLAVGRVFFLTFRPLHTVVEFLVNKLLFLLQPFIVMGTGIYTLFFLWPVQFANYLATTFYPLYVFLACASIVGLLMGLIAATTSSFLNNLIFPFRPHKPPVATAIIKKEEEQHPPSRPKTSDSFLDSIASSGTVTPLPLLRPPPPSTVASDQNDRFHILDTNALFQSFSLPVPPTTPPGILYSAPAPPGSVVVGDTIFEEDDDSDERTPVAPAASWSIGAGRPLERAESAQQARGPGEGFLFPVSEGRGTWAGPSSRGGAKREGIDVQGIDWGDDVGVKRRRNRGGVGL